MKVTANTAFIILTALILAGGVYWYIGSQSATDLPVSASPTQNAAQIHFQSLVTELAPITFNTAIFGDQRFKVLQDITTTVAPEPPGRIDPFAPIAGVAAP